MKKYYSFLSAALIAFFLCAGVQSSFAQEEDKGQANQECEMKDFDKPDETGDSEVDGYVNESFELYDKVKGFADEVTVVDLAVKKAEEAPDSASKEDLEDLKSNLNALKTKGESLKSDCESLANKSDDAMGAAKDVKPMSKKPKAIKAIKTAINVNKESAKQIPVQLQKVAASTQKVTELMP